MTTALIGFAFLLGLCFFGFRVGFATLIVGFVGFALERGWFASLAMVAQQVTEDAQNYNLSVIPLFILMGIIYSSGTLFVKPVNRLFCSHNLVDFYRLRKCGKVCGVYINLNSTIGVEWKLSKILIVSRYQRLMSSKIAHPFGEGHWLNNRPQTS